MVNAETGGKFHCEGGSTCFSGSKLHQPFECAGGIMSTGRLGG